MRKSRIITGIGISAIAILALTACNSGTPGADPSEPGDGGDGETTALWEVASDVSLEGSPTFDAMTERGGVVVLDEERR